MKSQTSLVAREVRLHQWADQIRSCQNRPVDMSVDTWCQQNDITKANYYYRMREVRKACLEATGMEPATFVEIQDPEPINTLPQVEKLEPAASPIAVLHANGISLDILTADSPALLEMILKVMTYAE